MKELSELPDYSNEDSMAAFRKVGQFDYSKISEKFDSDELVKRGPIEMPNGEVYIGQWTADNERQGLGKQLWSDGAVYEGSWYNDC